jgi:RNA polymerase sigma factor (TIGR02999 family)
MNPTSSNEITLLLLRWSGGEPTAINELLPMVYDELRKLAKSYLRKERLNHSLQPTSLVHEAYLKMVNQPQVNWENRAQFFGLAATMMRNILVDHARKRDAEKRGGGEIFVSLSHADRIGKQSDVNLLALDDALKNLADNSPKHARVVELRYFGGLTIEETALVMSSSHATVERDWSFARAWLKKELTKS